MSAWWTGLDVLHQIFYLIALPFTLILVIQTILLLLGLGQDGDMEVDHDLDQELDPGIGHEDIGAQHIAGLRMLSIRGIVAFMAVCGWVGVFMLDIGVGNTWSVIAAVIAGFLAMLLVAVFMRMMTRMQQAGNVDPQNAVGKTGEVYIPIPVGQKGKVTLMVQERLMEMDAVSAGGDLKTGQQVRVVRVTEGNVLVVEPMG